MNMKDCHARSPSSYLQPGSARQQCGTKHFLVYHPVAEARGRKNDASKVFHLKRNRSIVPPFPTSSFPIMFLSPSPCLVCSAVHTVLTGPRARRRTDAGVAIRKDSLVEIWDGIERFWEDFESLRHGAGGISTLSGGLVREEDVERFVSG
ncbi:hypothetical protein P692DRAFT_20218263 [Suillus brevipes Sb2]|nr:hypothetical protein P692DRAFT_20218263 [Suillus brevipes Sb2]